MGDIDHLPPRASTIHTEQSPLVTTERPASLTCLIHFLFRLRLIPEPLPPPAGHKNIQRSPKHSGTRYAASHECCGRLTRSRGGRGLVASEERVSPKVSRFPSRSSTDYRAAVSREVEENTQSVVAPSCCDPDLLPVRTMTVAQYFRSHSNVYAAVDCHANVVEQDVTSQKSDW